MSQYNIAADSGSPALDVETLTGNDLVVVGPDANQNIDVRGTGNITTTGNAGTNRITIAEVTPSVITLTGTGGATVSPTGAGNIDIAGSGNITVISDPGNNRLTIADTSAPVLTLTGNNGGQIVGPDGVGDIDITGTGTITVTGSAAGNSLVITNAPLITVTCGTGQTINVGTADIVTVSLGGAAAAVTLRAIIAGKAESAHGIGGQVVATARTTGGVATIIDTPDIISNADLPLAAGSFTFVASGNDIILRAFGALGAIISWSACVESRSVIAGI